MSVAEHVVAFKVLARKRDTGAIDLDGFHDELKVIVEEIESQGVRRLFFDTITKHDPTDEWSERFMQSKYRRRGTRR